MLNETVTFNWGQIIGMIITIAITILSYVYMAIGKVEKKIEDREKVIFEAMKDKEDVIFASMNKKEQESKDSFKSVDQKIDSITDCNSEIKVEIAKINTTLEFVKSQNTKMSLNIETLIKGSSLEKSNK